MIISLAIVTALVLIYLEVQKEKEILAEVEQTYKDYADGIVNGIAARKRIETLKKKFSTKYFRNMADNFMSLIS